jgi:hypothetical protein
LLCAVLLFGLALARKKAVLFAIAGCAFGAAYFVNETTLLLPIGLAVLFWATSKGMFKCKAPALSAAHMAIFLAVFVLFPLGWSIRNHLSLPENAAKGSKRALATLSHGAYPGFVHENPKYKYYAYREDPRQPEFSSSIGSFAAIFWERAKDRPLRYLSWYLIEKPYYLWSWNILQGQGDVYVYPVRTSLFYRSAAANAARTVMKALHPLILLVSLAGLVLFVPGVRRFPRIPEERAVAMILFCILIYYTLLYTVFAPWPRYSVPLRPFLYVWALWSSQVLLSISLKRGRDRHEAA